MKGSDDVKLLQTFSDQEKIACINYLSLVAQADGQLDAAELTLINLLILSLGIHYDQYDTLKGEDVKRILLQMDKEKSLECLRIAYQMVRLHDETNQQEVNYLRLLADVHHINLSSFPRFYENLNGTHDLTALDKLILIALAKSLMLVDEQVKSEQIELLVVLSDMMGIPIHVIELIDLPFDLMVKAMKSMHQDSIDRIVEELTTIMIADGRITFEEYQMMLPIYTAFDIDLNDVLKVSAFRLDHHQEYYQLLNTEGITN